MQALADGLIKCGVRTAAMEATGVYWVPILQILEARGLEVCLVNARHVKHVPGRKTDGQDCQWLQYLHSVGLLNASFRPPAAVGAVRSLGRHRGEPGAHRLRAFAARAKGPRPNERAAAPRRPRHHRL